MMSAISSTIVGVDEAGRGPLAGPVVAAAVILNKEFPIIGLKDSKLLTPKKRELLAKEIQLSAWAFGIGEASVEEIDALNIHWASLLAMERAITQLEKKYVTKENDLTFDIVIDGKYCPKNISHPMRAIVKADSLIPEVSAASIVAKVTRDKIMCDYHEEFPHYQFPIHKGYPTTLHKELIQQHGLSRIHRRSFKCL